MGRIPRIAARRLPLLRREAAASERLASVPGVAVWVKLKSAGAAFCLAVDAADVRSAAPSELVRGEIIARPRRSLSLTGKSSFIPDEETRRRRIQDVRR